MDKKIKDKLLYVITKSSWGGAQRYLFDLASHFNTTHDVLVGFGKNEFSSENIFKQKLDEQNISNTEIKYLGRNISIFGDVLVFFSLLSLFKKERPDILHLNSSKIGALGAIAGRILGIKKIVYTTHGLPFFEDRPQWQNTTIKSITKLTCLLSHEVITVAQYELEFIKENWPHIAKKTTRVYNAIHPINFVDPEAARKKVLENADNKTRQFIEKQSPLILGSIGELTKNKGYTYLLDALAQLKKENVPVIFTHYGTGVLSESLKEQAVALNLTDQIIWNGFSKQAPNLLPGLDAFVLPSRKEGFVYVLLEAAQAGIATIGTNVGGIPEIIKDKDTGLVVEAKDSMSLATALKELIEKKDNRNLYAKNLKTLAAQEFTLTQMLTKTAFLYNR